MAHHTKSCVNIYFLSVSTNPGYITSLCDFLSNRSLYRFVAAKVGITSLYNLTEGSFLLTDSVQYDVDQPVGRQLVDQHHQVLVRLGLAAPQSCCHQLTKPVQSSAGLIIGEGARV